MKHETYSQLRNLHYEKANKPYFGIERKMRMKNDRIITEMKAHGSTGTCRTSHSIINKAVHPYYKDLYNKKNTFDSCKETCLNSYSKIVPKDLREKIICQL